MNLRSGITTARRTAIAAILHREPTRRRAAAIRRRLVPTLRLAAATAVAAGAPVVMVEVEGARVAMVEVVEAVVVMVEVAVARAVVVEAAAPRMAAGVEAPMVVEGEARTVADVHTNLSRF